MKLSAINELCRRVGFAFIFYFPFFFFFFFEVFGKCWDKGKPMAKFRVPLFPASTGNVIKPLAFI